MAPNELILSQQVLDFFPDPVLILDHDSTIEFANAAFLEMLGYAFDEIINTNVMCLLVDQSIFETCNRELQLHGKCTDQETHFWHKDGSQVRIVKSVNFVEQKGRSRIFVNIRNLSQLDKLHKNLVRNHEQIRLELNNTQLQLEEILNAINDLVWYIDDRNLHVRYVSSAVEPIFGISKEAFLSAPTLWTELIHENDRHEVHAFFASLQHGDSRTIDFRICRSDGEILWLRNHFTHKADLGSVIGVTYDITENKKNEALVKHMAYHDALTDLPNRRYLQEKIDAHVLRSDAPLALLFLDLDNFKYVNDSMGHEVGDAILTEAARRFNDVITPNAICTRFGGDEFIIMIENVTREQEVIENASRLIQALSEPFSIREHEFFIACSIGISLYPQDGLCSNDLVKHADTAMYEAKQGGKGRYTRYAPDMDNKVGEFLRIEALLRDALSNDYLALHFQPLIDAQSGLSAGFEALLRFEHPEAGFISPVEFIPVAEATGDIIEIGYFVIDQACLFLKQLQDQSNLPLFVSLNVSMRQFTEKEFVGILLESIARHGVDPARIKLELTESIVMENIDQATIKLKKLKEAGVKIALDDFGTGYSSFNYLVQLPIDTLKIDKSFVIELFENRHNQHIIEAITHLAHTMEMSVVAEGVETEAHADYLRNKKVDLLQGFYFSKAIPAEMILSRLPAIIQNGNFAF